MHHELYFSKSSRTWQDKGIAFIKSIRSNSKKTFGRIYLITEEQFICVICQENGLVYPCNVNINVEEVKKQKEFLIEGKKFEFYGRVIYLGEKDGYPIFTITAKWDDNKVSCNCPSREYLGIIINGLKEVYNFGKEEIVNYFMDKCGIKGKLNKKKLEEIVKYYWRVDKFAKAKSSSYI